MDQNRWEPADHIFTVIRRTEGSLRVFITTKMRESYGESWNQHLPGDLIQSARHPTDPFSTMVSSDEIWYESYFRHLSGVITKNWQAVFSKVNAGVTRQEIHVRLETINKIRQRAYHARPVFSSDLTQVASEAKAVAEFMGPMGRDLGAFLERFWLDPAGNTIPLPPSKRYTNDIFVDVPVYDFELIGRDQEIRQLEQYIRGRDAVITVAGRGGVGKTALATKLVHHLWDPEPASRMFKAIIWVTGKDAELRDTGIVDLQPQLTNYEQLIETIDAALQGEQWSPGTLEEMEANVGDLLGMDDTPVLIVLDNLETISGDYRIINFIKDVPNPSKILVTSRLGIGEIERRIPLTGLSDSASRHLARMTARQVGNEMTEAILRLDDQTLSNWLSPVDGVAVAIKWMVAQVGLGTPFEKVKAIAGSSEGDLVEYLFRDVYNLLSDSAKTMMCVLIIFRDRPPSDELWRMVSGLDQADFEDGKQQLVLASMITHSIEDGV